MIYNYHLQSRVVFYPNPNPKLCPLFLNLKNCMICGANRVGVTMAFVFEFERNEHCQGVY